MWYQQCPMGGVFPASEDINWPNCTIQNCVEIPSLPHFDKVTNTKVKVGDSAIYVCSTNGFVTDNGAKQLLECKDDGSFDTR